MIEKIEEFFSGIEGNFIDTKYGRKMLKTIPVEDLEYSLDIDLWSFWKKDKQDLKDRGFSVSKYKGFWEFQKWENLKEEDTEVEDEEEYRKELKKIKMDRCRDFLLDFQKEHVKKLIWSLMKNGSVLDASETGTGKTYTSLAVAKQLNAFPIVITKKAVRLSFEKVMKEHFLMDGFVSNYESYKAGKTPFCKVEKETDKRKKIDKKFVWNIPENAVLIWDEAHSIGNQKTIQTKMFLDCIEKGTKNILMSATIADNPLKMYAAGKAVGVIKNSGQFYKWCLSRGCYRGQWGGIEFTKEKERQKKAMLKINKDFFPFRGSRLTTKEAGDVFPENRVIPELCEVSQKESCKIDSVYKKLKKELDILKKGKEIRRENEFGEIKVIPEVVLIMEARQEIELLKAITYTEIAKNLVSEGNSVPIFVNFNQTLDLISDVLKCPVIRGGQTEKEREGAIKSFKEDKERIIACNIKSGGVGIGLHDEVGDFPRISVISPDWSAVSLKQTLGRIYRANAKTRCIQKIIYVADTEEEKVYKKVSEKIENISLLNDGDLA